jgi:hypothetical protein
MVGMWQGQGSMVRIALAWGSAERPHTPTIPKRSATIPGTYGIARHDIM